MKYRVVIKELPSHLKKRFKPHFEMEAPTIQYLWKRLHRMFPWVHVIEVWPVEEGGRLQPYIHTTYIGPK